MAVQIGLALRNALLFGQADRANARLQSALSNVAAPIVCVQPDGTVRLWSRAAEQLFGHRAQDALGRPLGQLWGGSADGQLARHLADAASSPEGGAFEAAAASKAGQPLALAVSASPVRDKQGRVDEIVLLVQDVTACHRELQLTKTFLRSALDGIQDFISIVDRDYCVVFANEAACRRSGLPRDAVFGHKCHLSYWASPSPCASCMTVQTFADAQPHYALFEAAFRDGKPRWLERWTYPILGREGRAEFVIEYCRDVTEQREQRRQLGRKVHELRQAYRQVASLNSQLLHAEKMASIGQMAAGLAHQVDSPLSTIFGYASMLSHAIADERQRQWLGVISEQADVCRRSVRKLLDFSRKGKFERSRVHLNELVERVLSLMEYVLRVRNVQVQTRLAKSLPAVWGSEDELQQLLFNLIGNANDAMPRGGRLLVATLAQDDGGRVEVAVADTGIGIPPENLPRIFEPFFTTKERGHGTGLGLTVCQDIVRNHQGTISVESPARQEGGAAACGARFTVCLPAAAAAPTAGAPP
jgi:PAS domain S-box-containing protein